MRRETAGDEFTGCSCCVVVFVRPDVRARAAARQGRRACSEVSGSPLPDLADIGIFRNADDGEAKAPEDTR